MSISVIKNLYTYLLPQERKLAVLEEQNSELCKEEYNKKGVLSLSLLNMKVLQKPISKGFFLIFTLSLLQSG